MFNWCPKCKRKFTSKGDLTNYTQIHDKEEKSDNPMRTVYVSELLAEANCEKCEDKSCDRCIMKEVLKELQEGNISASADGAPRSRVCARETLRSAPHQH